MTVIDRVPGCTCNHGHVPGFPNLGGYARCPVHDPNMQERKLSEQTKPMTQSDRDRIANETTSKNFPYVDSLEDLRQVVMDERILEAAHWQPIVEQLRNGWDCDKATFRNLQDKLTACEKEKDATISSQSEAIAELVVGLEAIRSDLVKKPARYGFVNKLISKHKKHEPKK